MASSPAILTAAEGGVIAGKYRLESLLGEGGMGSVWRAFNLQLEVPVALKLLRADLCSEELNERLRVEARAAAKLVHPSIVRVFDIGEAESGDPFIVMELLVGESLASLLQRGPLTPVAALTLLLPIAEALSLAHSRGVVHRDLKPDNIFLASEGATLQPKLLDFGIAKVTSGHTGCGPTLTQTGTLLGSPDYMSPEQAYGRVDIDERSDVWSFCVVLYEALCGRPPFLGENCQTLLRSIVNDTAPPLAQLANVPRELTALIEWGLAKDRDARPPSIFVLGQKLAAWLLAQGVHDDVTGSSIEAKWLGRHQDASTQDAAPSAPRAQHEHATLVSVVHPAPRRVSEPVSKARPPRRRALPKAAALAGLAFAGYWVTALTLDSRATSAPRAQAATAFTAPEPAVTRTVTTLPEVMIEASARVDGVVKVSLSDPPSNPPTVLASLHSSPRTVSGPVPRARAAVRATSAARPAALPQALPARSGRTDLLNPY